MVVAPLPLVGASEIRWEWSRVASHGAELLSDQTRQVASSLSETEQPVRVLDRRSTGHGRRLAMPASGVGCSPNVARCVAKSMAEGTAKVRFARETKTGGYVRHAQMPVRRVGQHLECTL